MDQSWPKIIKEVGFDFSWDEKKVWALNEPVAQVGISELEWHLDIPFLWEDGVYNLTPAEVISQPEKHPQEYQRTIAADLMHPIDIMENKGRWVILDGLHRLMKAKLQGQSVVQVRKIPRSRISEIQK